MKQEKLFEDIQKQSDYTTHIELPIYEIKGQRPHILSLLDNTKYLKLKAEILRNNNITEDEKKFLLASAFRHNVFYYERIAEYYAHANKDMQLLMEKSALVIIDFNNAYAHGYIQLANDLANQHFEHYGE